MTLSGATASAACPGDPEQRHRLRYAPEFMAAALLDDEEASDLTLNPRCHYDRTRLGQPLRPRGDVRHVAVDLTSCVDHHRPCVDGDARRERWLPGVRVVAVKVGERTLDG
jgi:hypothetical protein